MKKVLEFVDGRFGRRVLKPKYRRVWKAFWKTVGTVIAVVLFFGMMQVLQSCTDFINYVYWGIGRI